MSSEKHFGHNVIRDSIAGFDSSADDLLALRSNIALPHFPIAVVEEVFFSPGEQIGPETLDYLKKIGSSELAERIPRNTVLARVVTRGVDKSHVQMKLFLPVNSYDAQPVKPGESVFVFYSDPAVSTQIGYWWCRVPGTSDVDDMNYTHNDRKYEYGAGLTTEERIRGGTDDAPGFPNGGGTEETSTTAFLDDFDRIHENAQSNEFIQKEPVARFTKRPGDRAIFGSNGSRIVLGQDRTAEATLAPKPNSPAIDLVATSVKPRADGKAPVGNQPNLITNTRDYQEVDKNPKKKNFEDNVREGDPNFETDQSRIYITANNSLDESFSINIDGVDADSSENPGVGVKSNQVRIVARDNIKIVVQKDGEKSSTSFVMDGKNIIIVPADDGKVMVGSPDAPQKQVRGDDLLSWLNDTLKGWLDRHTHPTGTGPSGPPVPDPATTDTKSPSITDSVLSKKANIE